MPPETATPFDEDTFVCELAARFGLQLDRYQSIEIYDEAAIAHAGLMRSAPDYPRIRKALHAGANVPGARLADVEYKLRRKQA